MHAISIRAGAFVRIVVCFADLHVSRAGMRACAARVRASDCNESFICQNAMKALRKCTLGGDNNVGASIAHDHLVLFVGDVGAVDAHCHVRHVLHLQWT